MLPELHLEAAVAAKPRQLPGPRAVEDVSPEEMKKRLAAFTTSSQA